VKAEPPTYHGGVTATSFLRIYLPANVLVAEGVRLPVTTAERPDGLREAAGVGLVRGSIRDDLLVAEWQGRRYGCPRRPLLRAFEGLLAFRSAYADIGAELLVPERSAQLAAEQLDSMYQQPLGRSHILTSPWHVPLRWFAAFDPSEREVLGEPGSRSIRYRTSQEEAVGRLEQVMAVLTDVEMDAGVTSEVEELAQWLAPFPPTAMLELDYGTVTGLFDEAELVMDETASELWESITALADEDYERASAHYAAAARRWAGPMMVTFSS
jgi:hypothetical protein